MFAMTAKQRAMLAHLLHMTVSMRVMRAGDGYKYLLRSFAAADADRWLSTPLIHSYAEAGTPPCRWLHPQLFPSVWWNR